MSIITVERTDQQSQKRAFYSDPDRKPVAPAPLWDEIPDELRAERRWVLWRLQWKGNRNGGGKWDKVPHQSNGACAKSNTPDTWGTFEEVQAGYSRGEFDGIGFMLGEGFVGIDLDDVRDRDTGAITAPWAEELIEGASTYAEVSPSGTGIKLFGHGTWPGNWNKKAHPSGSGEIEVYDSGRFFCVTGNPASARPVGDFKSALGGLLELFPEVAPNTIPQEPGVTELSNTDLIERARRAKNGDQFSSLWLGKCTGYPSQSEADLALCGMLAFWTGNDAQRIDILFQQSGLMRPKWNEVHGERTYGATTIAKALEGLRKPREPGTPKSGAPKPPPAVDLLVELAMSAFQLWHDPKQVGYASRERHTVRIRSREFRLWLGREFRCKHGKIPSSEAIASAIGALEAEAVYGGAEGTYHVRTARHEDRLYLHLADAADTVIEIGSEGWRSCANPPVKFVRAPGMLALPGPATGGSLDDLRRFVNCPGDAAFSLLKAWVTSVFQPAGALPLLVLSGEQGSAKSTTALILKRILDPCEGELRCEPTTGRDLMIAAQNAGVLAFDNVTHLPGWLSDHLCRLATGAAFSTRELFTNEGEVIFAARRPVLANGITDFVTKPDLLQRSILLRLPPIPVADRRPESELWTAFELARPRLLGAILDRVSVGLAELGRVGSSDLPRMADFARFALACERGTREHPRFLEDYKDNQSDGDAQALEATPVTEPLLRFMEANANGWEGTATVLHERLNTELSNTNEGKTIHPHGWPKRSNELGNILRRIAPNLRQVYGLDVRSERTSQQRTIQLSWLPGDVRGASSLSSPSSRTPEVPELWDDND